MNTWFTYLKQGLSRELPEDRIAGQQAYAGLKANLPCLVFPNPSSTAT
jgi:hypothetical protein